MKSASRDRTLGAMGDQVGGRAADLRTLAIVIGALAVCLGWVALTISQGWGNCVGLREVTPIPLNIIHQARLAKPPITPSQAYYYVVCAKPRHQLAFEFAATILAAAALVIWQRKPAGVPH